MSESSWVQSIKTMLETEREALADELLALGLFPSDMLAASRRDTISEVPKAPMLYEYYVVYYYAAWGGETIVNQSWGACNIECSLPLDKSHTQIRATHGLLVAGLEKELKETHPEIDRVELVIMRWHRIGEPWWERLRRRLRRRRGGKKVMTETLYAENVGHY